MNTRHKRESKANKQRQDAGADSLKAGVNYKPKNSKDSYQASTKVRLPQVGDEVQTSYQNAAAHAQRLKQYRPRWWRRLSLKTKATTLAIALSTIPIVLLGVTAYYLTNKNITASITQQQQARAVSLANQLDRFMLGRYQDIQTLAGISIFNNSQVRALTSDREKQAVLDRYIKNGQGYDSIVLLDLEGNVVLQSSGQAIPNYSKIDYFQAALKSDRPIVTPPRRSLATGDYAIFVAAPVKNSVTGETIGVVRSRTPVQSFNQIVQKQTQELAKNIEGIRSEEFLAINEQGKVFIAPTAHRDYLGKDAKTIFPNVVERLQTASTVGSVEDAEQLERENYLVSYAPLKSLGDAAPLNWGVLVAQPTDEIFAGLRGLLWTLLAGTAVTVLIAALAAAIWVNRALLRPIVGASKAVRKLGQGQLDTRIPVVGEDELAVLGANINRMAEQLQAQLEQQQDVAERANLLADITLRIRQSLNFKDILNTAVKEVRKFLKAERVIVYAFDANWKGKVVAEAVTPGWTQTLDREIDDSCFREGYALQYREGRVRAIDNIYQAGLSTCYVEQLEQFEVQATLVAPIIKENELLGLLIAHHCSKPRVWQQSEIDLFTQLATQIGFALDQASLLEQVETARQQAEVISQEQRRQKEFLQQQLVQLLMQIEGAASGDLTVRAKETAGEIGTVTDFFNTIIESLRQLVMQVKKAAGQVNISVGENAGAIRELADEAIKQAQEINRTLDSVEQMTLSIQAVAASANQAADVARTAFATAEAGGVAMERTVDNIFNLRDTVTQTASQVKLLGESTQQISKVVSLINQIALQTNVLAINASIEASRAGEAGRGFTVVAEEIGQLATKSASATKEIEQIVENIQLETSKVVRAMELGNNQAIAGAHFVEDSKQSLGRILEESHQIYQLVQSISSATVSQAETAQAVTNLMQEIAAVSEGTSEYSRQISNSLQRTVEVAQQLQVSVGTFKVGDESNSYGSGQRT
jgi:twitching motility protein PilJ